MKISFALSVENLNNLCDRLDNLATTTSALESTIIDNLVTKGEKYATTYLGKYQNMGTIVGYRNGNQGFIVANGDVTFIEFGTGVRYNTPVGTSPHPQGTELGMTIGSYGQGKGANEQGWVYYDETKERFVHTYGIQANMFMYRTAQQLRQEIPKIAELIGNL